MDQQLVELTKAIQKLQVQNDAIHAAVKEIKPAVLDLQKWKPEIEMVVDGLRLEVGELRAHVGQIACNPILTVRPEDLPRILPTSKVKPEFTIIRDSSPPGKEELGQLAIRGKGGGENFSSTQPVGAGMYDRSDGNLSLNDSAAIDDRVIDLTK